MSATTMTERQAPTIRKAELADVSAIQEMFAYFVASTQYRRYVGNNPEYSRDLIARLIAYESTSAIFVVEDPTDGIFGMFGLTIFQHPFSGERVAQESFWWLNPDRRGYGVYLLRRAERWARSHGARRLSMMAPSDNPRVGEIYTRLGYLAVEVTYQKDLV